MSVQLSEDILVLIFRKVAIVEQCSLAEWKNNLCLLSVSSEWRKAAIPIVYSYIGISCSVSTRPASNICLVAELNGLSCVKYLRIDTDAQVPVPNLDPALFMLSSYKLLWPSIKTLDLYSTYQKRNRYFNEDMLDNYERAFKEYAQTLVTLAPNITNMRFAGQLPVQESVLLLQLLCQEYGNKIKTVYSEYPVAVTGNDRLSGLTHLDTAFVYCKRPNQLNICADSLTYLCLRNVPLHFNWACFAHKTDSIIKFPVLQTLRIASERSDSFNFFRNEGSKIFPYTFHFPQLAHIEMSHPIDCHYLFNNSVFGSQIKHIRLNLSHNSLSSFPHTCLPLANAVSLNIVMNSTSPICEMADEINAFGVVVKNVLDVSLELEKDIQLDISDGLHSTFITRLVVKPRVNAQSIINILSGLPNLVHFEIGQYLYDDTHSLISNTPIAPNSALNAKLRSLVFWYNPYYCNPDSAAEILKCMLLGLPRLIKVVAKKTPCTLMFEFVEQFNDSYPHLSEISFELESND